MTATAQATPLEMLSIFLRLIYDLLGGDPSELEDPRLSLTTRLNIVRGHYETYGVPQDLSLLEKQQLIDAVLATNLLIMDPLILLQATPKAVDLFDNSLHDMWDELGAPGILP